MVGNWPVPQESVILWYNNTVVEQCLCFSDGYVILCVASWQYFPGRKYLILYAAESATVNGIVRDLVWVVSFGGVPVRVEHLD